MNEITNDINGSRVVLSFYSLWLHSLCLFNVKTFAGSTYGFSFGVDKFEWDKFDVRKLVSGLIKMLCYCVVSQFCFVSLCGVLQTCLLRLV